MGLCIFADKTKINLSLRLPRRKTSYMLEEFFIIREKIYLMKLQYDLFAIPRINQLHFPIYKKIMMFFKLIFFPRLTTILLFYVVCFSAGIYSTRFVYIILSDWLAWLSSNCMNHSWYAACIIGLISLLRKYQTIVMLSHFIRW